MALSVSTAILLAAPSVAATVDIDQQHASSVFKDRAGQNAWSVNVYRTLTQGNQTIKGNIAAGLFRVTEDLPGTAYRDFLAFCLSPGVWLNLNVDYTSGTGLNNSVIGALGALRRNAFDSVMDSVTAGAFQIAVWEIVSETGSYNLNSGAIKFSGGNQNTLGALALATSWLGNIESGVWKPSTSGMVFHKAKGVSQDLLEVAPVPLPAAGLLMLASLASFFGLRRRKAALAS